MTDERLAELFAEGTAPERDAAFAARVDAEIRRARLRVYLPLAVRAFAFLALAGAVFAIARLIEPVLAPIAETSPQFMGVPLPLALSALAAGLVVCARRFLFLRAG